MSFEFRIRVYWEDTDAGGIVFYANYLKFFERARTEWLRSLGLQQSELRTATGGMFIVGETRVRYLRPARLDDELRVTAELETSGRATLLIRQEAWRKADLLAEGSIRIGWVHSESLRPARIPSIVHDRMKP
jgi:acyl-CoA thioester hydrolase